MVVQSQAAIGASGDITMEPGSLGTYRLKLIGQHLG
jgi:hypothetical protein